MFSCDEVYKELPDVQKRVKRGKKITRMFGLEMKRSLILATQVSKGYTSELLRPLFDRVHRVGQVGERKRESLH